MAAVFCIKHNFQLDLEYEKIFPNYTRKTIFHGDDVIDDVTEWLQIRSSIFLDK